jgi:predicted metalloprotease with PDZ domain
MTSRVAVAAFSIALPALASSQDTSTYRFSYSESAPHHVSVQMELPRLAPGPQVLVVPRAIPMGYGEQHFDRFVDNVRAFAFGGQALPVSRQDGPRWQMGRDDTAISRIEYDVDIHRMEQEITSASDTSRVRPRYLSLLGYSLFAYLEGFEEWDVELIVRVPEDWPVMTTLAPAAPPAKGMTSGKASNFYELADSQIVAGPALCVHRLKSSVPLFLALYAEGEADATLMGRLAKEAMASIIQYFGHVPFPHYTVLQELLRPISERHRYGFSMEHMASATFYLGIDRSITAESSPREITRTLYNYAHHFAHAWIPKRAYSKGYYPFTWEIAPVLDTIWFSEGFPQYAAIEAIADGLSQGEASTYRENMLQMRFRSNIENAPLFIRQMSTIELSRVASTRYSEDFRTGRNVFSRGGLMAAEMDERIRRETGGTKRLRDGLRHLMVWSRKNRRPFEIDEIPDIFEEATGVDTREVMEKWLSRRSNGGS